MPTQNQNPFAPFGGVFGAGLTGMNNAFASLPWWQQQPQQGASQMMTTMPAQQQERIDVPPGQRQQFGQEQQQNPWTPAAVQALMHGMSQDKASRAISPADQYKANMWASVPGSIGGAPAAPFSWNMPGGTTDPIGRIQHYLAMQQPTMRVASPLMPGLDPLGNVTNRVLPNPTTMQLQGMQPTGTLPSPAATQNPFMQYSANPNKGFSFGAAAY